MKDVENKGFQSNGSDVDNELELMLKAVEKAGRDSRRREALSVMLDQMAADEAAAHRKVVRRRWSIAVSAAACLLLFVTTIVRLTNIGDGVAAGPLTAEVDDRPIMNGDTVATDSDVQPDALPVRSRKAYALAAAEPTPVMAETTAPQEDTAPVPPAEEQEVDSVSIGDEVLYDAGQFAENDVPESEEKEETMPSTVSPQPAQVATNTTAPKPAKSRSRWMRHHRDDRSKMDGTMLAFNIL